MRLGVGPPFGAGDRLVASPMQSQTDDVEPAKRSSAATLTDGLPRAVEDSRHWLARGSLRRRRRIDTRLRSADHSALSLLVPGQECSTQRLCSYLLALAYFPRKKLFVSGSVPSGPFDRIACS